MVSSFPPAIAGIRVLTAESVNWVPRIESQDGSNGERTQENREERGLVVSMHKSMTAQ